MNTSQLVIYGLILFLYPTVGGVARAQVGAVKFGKNRVQYENFRWKVIDMKRFDLYYNGKTDKLASEIAYTALEELENWEEKLDFSLPNKFNIVFYLSYEQYLSSNIGSDLDWSRRGGVARLVNNKIPIYYSSSLRDVRRQLREALLRLIIEYSFTGEEKGEKPQEEKIVNVPAWIIKGYIAYRATGWNAQLDYQLRVRIMEYVYKSFGALLNHEQQLAGQTMWYYLERQYGKKKLDETIEAMQQNKSINSILKQVIQRTYSQFTKEIFPYFIKLFQEDERKRKDQALGKSYTRIQLHRPNAYRKYTDVISIIANPSTKKGIYARIDFKEGRYKVVVSETRSRKKTILRTGIYLYDNKITENYPQIAWTPNGTRLGVVYYEKNQLLFFEYDILRRTRVNKQALSLYFTSVHDFQYLNDGALLLSAVKNGQSDIFTFNIRTKAIENITQDVYDNIDPSYVTFGKKIGIVFSSNRPVVPIDSLPTDTEKYDNNYNIFIADYSVPKGPHPITPLTFCRYGDARYPSQYNSNSFSYLSDENGIRNRYIADVVSTQLGIDTFYTIADETYKNVSFDSLRTLLRAKRKTTADKRQLLIRTQEKTRASPITNYAHAIIESKYSGGAKPMLTDLKYTTYTKQLYLVDAANTRRESSIKLPPLAPTAFRLFQQGILVSGKGGTTTVQKDRQLFTPTDPDSIAYYKDYFVSRFAFNPLLNTDLPPQLRVEATPPPSAATPSSARGFFRRRGRVRKPFSTIVSNPTQTRYLPRFFLNMLDVSLDGTLLADQAYQPYAGGQGPILLNGQNKVSGMITFNTFENLEHWKILTGYRLPLSLQNIYSDFITTIEYLKSRVDYGFTYLRSSTFTSSSTRNITSYFLGQVKYPIDILRSVRFIFGPRRDWFNYKLVPNSDQNPNIDFTKQKDSINWTNTFRAEFVYDNSIAPAINVHKGIRLKVYVEMFLNIGRYNTVDDAKINLFNFDQNTFNLGFDLRHYKALYKDVVWANRLSGDLSYGQRPIIYYLGGTDRWFSPQFNQGNQPDPTQNYAFQTLAVAVRGFKQNIQNGRKNFVFNTEFRLPLLTTFIRRPIHSDILRSMMAVLFLDAGSAWNNGLPKIASTTLEGDNTIVHLQSTSLPFVVGYGLGVRAYLFGYYLRVERGWAVGNEFLKNGLWYISVGYDF